MSQAKRSILSVPIVSKLQLVWLMSQVKIKG